MRSGTIVRPGERTGCAGCHESRQKIDSLCAMPLAMHRRLQCQVQMPAKNASKGTILVCYSKFRKTPSHT